MEQLMPNGTLLVQMVLFLISFVALKNWLFEPYVEVLERRHHNTEGAGDELEELRDRIQETQRQVEEHLSNARHKGHERRAEIVAEAKKQAQQKIDESQSKAQERVEAARREIAEARRSVEAELEPQIADVAAQASDKLTGAST